MHKYLILIPIVLILVALSVRDLRYSEYESESFSSTYEPLKQTAVKYVDQVVKNAQSQESLTPKKLRDLIDQHNQSPPGNGQDAIDFFLAMLPANYRRHFTFVHRSYSPQKGTPTSPRTILFGADARVVMTFNAGHEANQPMAGGDTLEVMEWNQEKYIWDFSEIKFGSDGRANHEMHPAKCVMCHSGTPKAVEAANYQYYRNYLKPIFPQYPFWPGFYGSVNDIVGVQGSRDSIMNNFNDTLGHIRGLTFRDTEELFRLKKYLDENPKYVQVVKDEHEVHAKYFQGFISGIKNRDRYRHLIQMTDLYDGQKIPEHLRSAPYRRTFDKEYGHYLLRPNFYLSSLLSFYQAQYIARQMLEFPLYDKMKFTLLARKYNCDGSNAFASLDPSFDLVYPNLKDQDTRDRQYLLAYQYNVVRAGRGGPAQVPLHTWNLEGNEDIASYHYGNVFSDLNELVLWKLLTEAFKDIKFSEGRHAAEERHYSLPGSQYHGTFLESVGGYVSKFSTAQMNQALKAQSYNGSNLKFKAMPYSKYCASHIMPAATKEFTGLKQSSALPHQVYAVDKRFVELQEYLGNERPAVNAIRQACESCHTAEIPPQLNVNWYSEDYHQTVKPIRNQIAQVMDPATLPVPYGNSMPHGRRPMDNFSLQCEMMIVDNAAKSSVALRGLAAFQCADPNGDSLECRCRRLYRLKEKLYRDFTLAPGNSGSCMMLKRVSCLVVMSFALSACAGLKVVDPNKPDTKGTLQVDYSGGSPKLVGTHTCTMVGANGKRVYATGKSEDDARKEAIAKCQDQTLVSFCKSSKISCEKN